MMGLVEIGILKDGLPRRSDGELGVLDNLEINLKGNRNLREFPLDRLLSRRRFLETYVGPEIVVLSATVDDQCQ
jgi:hypothetical protein